jgi:hypothetical protein
MLEALVCPACGQREQVFASLGKVAADRAWCPACRAKGNDVRREVVTFFALRGDEPFIDRPLAEIGVPPFDILIARSNRDGRHRSVGFELSGDAASVLGPLVSSSEALELAPSENR